MTIFNLFCDPYFRVEQRTLAMNLGIHNCYLKVVAKDYALFHWMTSCRNLEPGFTSRIQIHPCGNENLEQIIPVETEINSWPQFERCCFGGLNGDGRRQKGQNDLCLARFSVWQLLAALLDHLI